MAENAPLFNGADGGILPKNTTPLTNRLVNNGLVSTTVGAAAGTTTTVNKTHVKGHSSTDPDPFGAATLESEALINRASAAADVTAMKTKFTKKKASFGYVADLSGNGGPAFTRG